MHEVLNGIVQLPIIYEYFYIGLPTNCEYVINFSPQLSEIISETKYMEKLGFDVSAYKILFLV